MNTITEIIDPSVRYDAVMLWDATLSNPNGDPDMDNAPRTDPPKRSRLRFGCLSEAQGAEHRGSDPRRREGLLNLHQQ